MDKHTEVGVTELRQTLRQHIRDAADGRPVVIANAGIPVAALVSVTDLRQLDQWRQESRGPVVPASQRVPYVPEEVQP